MNRLTSSLVALFMVSSVSAETSVNIGIGAVARKTSFKTESKDPVVGNSEFQKDGNIGYFAGRVNVHAFYNMFGVRVSADIGNDKKQFIKAIKPSDLNKSDVANDAISIAKYKSNFTVRIAPAIQYNVGKFTVCSSIGGVFKHEKLSLKVILSNQKKLVETLNPQIEKKNSFGVGGHVGVNYHFNSKISAFVEASADFMMKKNNSLKLEQIGSVKFTSKSSLDFAGCIGVAAQIIG